MSALQSKCFSGFEREDYQYKKRIRWKRWEQGRVRCPAPFGFVAEHGSPLSMYCGRNLEGVVETSHRKEKSMCIEM